MYSHVYACIRVDVCEMIPWKAVLDICCAEMHICLNNLGA